MRLFLVEWKKMVHQKLFYLIGVLLVVCGLFYFVQINWEYQRLGDIPMKKWEYMKQDAEKFLDNYRKYDKNLLEWSQISQIKKEEVEQYERKLAFAERMILDWQSGNWRTTVEEQLKIEKERLNRILSFSEKNRLAQIKFQAVQYQYLLDYDIPIWKNNREVNGWNVINRVMCSMIPWTALGVGILGAVIMSREKKTLTTVFVVPYGKGSVVLAKNAVLIIVGIGFLLISVGIPAVIAAVMNGMGSYNYPLHVGQRILQISESKELAPLIICITAIFCNGSIFLSLISAFSMFCSICFMCSKCSIFLVVVVIVVGVMLPNRFLTDQVIPVLGYGNSKLLLEGIWDFGTGIGIMIVLALLFIMVSISIVKRNEFINKEGACYYNIKN